MKKKYMSNRFNLILIVVLFIGIQMVGCLSKLKDDEGIQPFETESLISSSPEASKSLLEEFISTPTEVKEPRETKEISSEVTNLPELTKQPDLFISEDEYLQRWLISPPCHPPCWEEITPGETSAEKAMETLSSNPMFSKVEIIESPLKGVTITTINASWITINQEREQTERTAQLLYDKSKSPPYIEEIRMSIAPIRLEEFISALGEPSHIRATVRTENNQIVGWGLDIGWVPFGFIISTFGKSPAPMIDENLTFVWIYYIHPGLDNFLQFGDLPEGQYTYPWMGFATLEEYLTLDNNP